MRQASRITVLVLAWLAMLPFAAFGQELVAASPYDAPTAEQPVAYTQQQIDQLTAPIALYPDPLVGQILMAATYPLEIVEASRWRDVPQNAQLSGEALASALAPQPWDPSVKSLVAFPQVLAMMNNNLQWTEQLGDAFLAQQPVVMDSIQRLRALAQASGNLISTPQQTVAVQDGAILIEPANPQTVYVPAYNPNVIYGPWPYAAYPPYYFPPPPGVVYANVGLVSFGFGIVVIDVFRDFHRFDWRRHHIDLDDRRFEEWNRGHPPAFTNGVWAHDVRHRHGVPYQSQVTRDQFQDSADQTYHHSHDINLHSEGQITNAVPQHIAGPAERSQMQVPQHIAGPAERSQMQVPQHIAGPAERSQMQVPQHVAGPAERSQMQVPIRQPQTVPIAEPAERSQLRVPMRQHQEIPVDAPAEHSQMQVPVQQHQPAPLAPLRPAPQPIPQPIPQPAPVPLPAAPAPPPAQTPVQPVPPVVNQNGDSHQHAHQEQGHEHEHSHDRQNEQERPHDQNADRNHDADNRGGHDNHDSRNNQDNGKNQ